MAAGGKPGQNRSYTDTSAGTRMILGTGDLEGEGPDGRASVREIVTMGHGGKLGGLPAHASGSSRWGYRAREGRPRRCRAVGCGGWALRLQEVLDVGFGSPAGGPLELVGAQAGEQ